MGGLGSPRGRLQCVSVCVHVCVSVCKHMYVPNQPSQLAAALGEVGAPCCVPQHRQGWPGRI